MESIETAAENSAPSRNLDDPIRLVDLKREIEEAWRQLPTTHAGHTARTLLKHSMHRVVLLVIKEGAVIPEHQADAESSLFVISGRVAVEVDGDRHELEQGGLLGLGFGVPHEVEAHEDTAILLTLSHVG
jgi:quercetin dioxygenase-like cupin family protein